MDAIHVRVGKKILGWKHTGEQNVVDESTDHFFRLQNSINPGPYDERIDVPKSSIFSLSFRNLTVFDGGRIGRWSLRSVTVNIFLW
jgi:hypothetical protein